MTQQVLEKALMFIDGTHSNVTAEDIYRSKMNGWTRDYADDTVLPWEITVIAAPHKGFLDIVRAEDHAFYDGRDHAIFFSDLLDALATLLEGKPLISVEMKVDESFPKSQRRKVSSLYMGLSKSWSLISPAFIKAKVVPIKPFDRKVTVVERKEHSHFVVIPKDSSASFIKFAKTIGVSVNSLLGAVGLYEMKKFFQEEQTESEFILTLPYDLRTRYEVIPGVDSAKDFQHLMGNHVSKNLVKFKITNSTSIESLAVSLSKETAEGLKKVLVGGYDPMDLVAVSFLPFAEDEFGGKSTTFHLSNLGIIQVSPTPPCRIFD